MDSTRSGVDAGEEYLVVAGQELRLTNPHRVLYPATGTTKADVIAYYAAVANVMLPHLAGRPATRKRWPDGVTGEAFFVKQIEAGIPVWLSRVQITHRRAAAFYPVLDTPAALAWLGQVAALEVHVPQWRIPEPSGPSGAAGRAERSPDRVVFDLDPGEGAGLAECVQVALALRERLGALGSRMVPVTSGSKGLHLYVPMDQPITSEQASDWARLAAEELEKALPTLVVSTMAKTARHGKVLIDWSQNTGSKTTIAPYSLRGRDRPTVAAPRTWDELATPGLRHLELHEVLDRVAGGLDPMATQTDATNATPPQPAMVVRERRPRPAPIVVGGRRRPSGSAVAFPAGLAVRVQVALAKAQDRVPGPGALPGGSRYELKFDGFRMAVVGHPDGVRLWSKSGTDLTPRFPEIAAAAAAVVPDGTVLDGEAVIWQDERLDFELLQHRFTTSRTRLAEEARSHPGSYMVFDLLAVDGRDLRGVPLRTRRGALEELARDWTPPLQLSPVTDDEQLAHRWMTQYRPAGIEGLVVKGADTRYEPGARRWVKVKSRETTEVVIGAVIGTLTAPTAIVAGLYQQDGTLRMVGRSASLTRAQSHAVAAVLTAATEEHPWPDTMAATRFGSGRDRLVLTRVEPVVVVEVAADAARQHGVWRHSLRVIRLRSDLTMDDLPAIGEHVDSA